MDHAIAPPIWFTPSQSDAATGPEPKPRRAPVFIQDAVTPWGQDTMLLALWRQRITDHDE